MNIFVISVLQFHIKSGVRWYPNQAGRSLFMKLKIQNYAVDILNIILCFKVEKVIDSKRIKGKLHYLIRWKGYSADNDTWEPENTLSCPELINKFNEEVSTVAKFLIYWIQFWCYQLNL